MEPKSRYTCPNLLFCHSTMLFSNKNYISDLLSVAFYGHCFPCNAYNAAWHMYTVNIWNGLDWYWNDRRIWLSYYILNFFLTLSSSCYKCFIIVHIIPSFRFGYYFPSGVLRDIHAFSFGSNYRHWICTYGKYIFHLVYIGGRHWICTYRKYIFHLVYIKVCWLTLVILNCKRNTGFNTSTYSEYPNDDDKSW